MEETLTDFYRKIGPVSEVTNYFSTPFCPLNLFFPFAKILARALPQSVVFELVSAWIHLQIPKYTVGICSIFARNRRELGEI